MKFGELKIGAVFTLDGERYVKTSPMIALCETSGEQKFIRRSVAVVVSDTETKTKSAFRKRTLSQSQVANAFEDFYAQCEQCLQKLAPQADKQLVRETQEQLSDAKRQFLTKINAHS